MKTTSERIKINVGGASMGAYLAKPEGEGKWPGVVVFQEIFAGPGGEVVCRMPWATEPSTSFLVLPEQVRTLLLEAGFEERFWLGPPTDVRAASPLVSAAAIVHGPNAAAMEAATRRNQAEQRVIGYRAVFVRR